MAKFEDILSDINDFGKYQKIRYALICLAGLLPPIATYIYSFMAALPDYNCNIDQDLISTNISAQNDEMSNKCEYKYNGTIYKCESWSFDKKYFESTLTQEWNMVCDRSFLRSNVQSIYFCGYLVGSILLGNLADKFGRRPIMLISFLLILTGFVGSTFGPQEQFGFLISYIIYSVSRFLIACGTRGINETGYVLALELVSTKKRTYAAIGFEHFFSLGQLILVAVAYFVRDWRNLSLIMTFLVVPFLSYFFFIPESPRWLISKNKVDQATKILENVAKTNKRTFNTENWNEFLSQSKTNKKEETFLTLIKSYIKYPAQSILCLTMFFNWFIINFVFYGVGLKSVDLGVSPYLSFTIAAIVELISYTTTLFIIDKFGRKKTYFFFLFIAGLSCVSQVFITNLVASVALAMVGKFCVSASYGILRLYSNEVFPTSIRNSCIGACSMISRLGVIISPIIISLGDNGWKAFPFLIFGVCALMGALSTVLLPETLNKKLPETISDTRKLKKNKSKTSKNSLNDNNIQKNLLPKSNSDLKA